MQIYLFISDCQSSIESTLQTIHSFHQRRPGSGSPPGDVTKTPSAKVTSPPKLMTSSTSSPNLNAIVTSRSPSPEDDLITYYDCVTHGFQTANYILYLKHLVTFHEDFTKVRWSIASKCIYGSVQIYLC